MSGAAWAAVVVAGAALGFSIFAGVASLLATVAQHSETIRIHGEELKERRQADETWKREVTKAISEAANDIGWLRARISNSRSDLLITRDSNTN